QPRPPWSAIRRDAIPSLGSGIRVGPANQGCRKAELAEDDAAAVRAVVDQLRRRPGARREQAASGRSARRALSTGSRMYGRTLTVRWGRRRLTSGPADDPRRRERAA